MKARDILSWIRPALDADADLQAWCRDRYGTPLAVTVGWSPDCEPEGGWQYPCLNFALWKSRSSEGEPSEGLEWNIQAAIRDDDAGDAEGVLLADDLLHLVRDAILRAGVLQDTTVETVGGETAERPVYTARATITIKRLRSRRAGLGR